jgi:glycerate dehydrogenase
MSNSVKMVVLDGYGLDRGDCPWDSVARLGELVVHDSTPEDRVAERTAGAEIVLVNKVHLRAPVLERLDRLRFISVLATGYDIVDVAAARRRGVPVSNVPVYGTDSVAQLAIALTLELCHRVGLHSDLVHGGEWGRRGYFTFWESPFVELAGLAMGIVGFGRIGRRVGELAHALGMSVLACDTRPGEKPSYEPFAFASVEDVFRRSDVVSLHCPLTPASAGMVNAGLIEMMRPGAFLINTSRGGLVREADLSAALDAGRLAGAAVDVVSAEPIRQDNPLLAARNCIITPHVAWATAAARRRLMDTTARNIEAFLAGAPINVVN